jgi:hypothetical protein
MSVLIGLIAFSFSKDFEGRHFKKNEIFSQKILWREAPHTLAIEGA